MENRLSKVSSDQRQNWSGIPPAKKHEAGETPALHDSFTSTAPEAFSGAPEAIPKESYQALGT
jgi:hypothetical protein